MNNNVIIDSNITPTDVKIYVENGIPYLDYTGTCYMINGDKYKVHIPKIGLTLTNIKSESAECYDYLGHARKILPSFQIYACGDEYFSFEVIEREVSKKQLEKGLGYKLNIKE